MQLVKTEKTGKSSKALLISAGLSFFILFIVLLSANKYHVLLVNKESSISREKYYYHDFDKDGNSEKVFINTDNYGMLGLIIFNDLGIINHWNFKGEWAKMATPFMGDINKDKMDEIFVFTQLNDSLFLHCIDPMHDSIIFENKAVSKILKFNSLNDYEIFPSDLYDFDADGFNEIYFSINTGYTKHPRNVFVYNYGKDSILISPESCAPLFFPLARDIDNDSIPEFFCETYAYGNCDSDQDYSDQYTWLMVFRPDLSFKFEPIAMNIFPSLLKVSQLGIHEKFLVALSQYDGAGENNSYLALISKEGKQLKKAVLDKSIINTTLEIYPDPRDPNCFYIFANEGDVFKGDTCLRLKAYAHIDRIEAFFMNYYYEFDLDNDGQTEYVFYGQNRNQFVIVRSDFKHSTTVDLGSPLNGGWFSLKESNAEKPLLFVDTDEFSYLFEYGKTGVYRIWYILFLAIELGLLLLYFAYNKIKEFRRLKVNEAQKKITELQIKSFHNHLEPHFTFNILEAFGHLINERDTEKAKFIFTNYSKLLKAVILNSDKVFVTLIEELDFVKSYLDLEMYRNKNKFNAEIDFPEEAKKNMIIPKMLIQIFVENAIKHGVRHLKANGLIRIKGIRRNNAFIIQIEDNGIGREKAKQYAEFYTGKGLGIIDDILLLYNKLYANNIRYKIRDLNTDGTGTQVILTITTKTFSYGKIKN